jgi:hypothetical protein
MKKGVDCPTGKAVADRRGLAPSVVIIYLLIIFFLSLSISNSNFTMPTRRSMAVRRGRRRRSTRGGFIGKWVKKAFKKAHRFIKKNKIISKGARFLGNAGVAPGVMKGVSFGAKHLGYGRCGHGVSRAGSGLRRAGAGRRRRVRYRRRG